MMNRTFERRLARLEQNRGNSSAPRLWTTLATSEAEAEAFRQDAIAAGEIEESSPYQLIILVPGRDVTRPSHAV